MIPTPAAAADIRDLVAAYDAGTLADPLVAFEQAIDHLRDLVAPSEPEHTVRDYTVVGIADEWDYLTVVATIPGKAECITLGVDPDENNTTVALYVESAHDPDHAEEQAQAQLTETED